MPLSIYKKSYLIDFSVLLISIVAFAEWQFNFNLLGVLNRSFLMSRATAITFLFCICSKLLFEFSAKNKNRLFAAKVLAGLTAAIGLLKIASIAFHLNSIEGLFHFQKPGASAQFYSTSMSLVTAISFVITGTALYLLALHKGEKIFWPHFFALLSLFIALLSAIAFFFDENVVYQISFYKNMGLAAAFNFLLISYSILMVNNGEGFMGHITSKYQGGKIARLLIPVAIAVPVLLGFFQLETDKLGVSNNHYTVAVLTLIRIIILVFFIWRTAVIINKSNKAVVDEIEERKKTETTLRYREALLEAHNEAFPDALLIVDTERKILFHNQHFTTLWAMPPSIIDGRDDAEAQRFAMAQLRDPDAFIKRINHIYNHPNEVGTVDEILFRDGRIVERYGNPVIGEDGTKYGWAWYFRDVTLKKNYESQIKNFNKDLEKKVADRTEDLLKSEKRFRLLVENSFDIISLVDVEGKIFFISPSIERLTGFIDMEMIGRSGFDLLHPEEIEGGKILRSKLIDKPGVPTNSMFRLKHKNGGYVWVEGTVTNMVTNENVKGFILNYHDITERKKSEERITASEKRFRSLIENAHDIISLSDENGVRFYISPAIEKLTGYTVAETINQPVFDLVHEDDLEQTKKLRHEFTQQPGVLKPISFRFKHKNGGFVWVEGTIINLLHVENVKAVVGNFHEITERKKAEEALLSSEKRFRSLIENAYDLLSLSDGNANLFYVSPSIVKLTGHTIEETINRSVFHFIHPDDIKNGEIARKKFMAFPGVSIPLTFRYLHKNGNYIWMEGTIINLLHNENVKAVVGNYHDITERKKHEEEIRISNERFEMVSRATNDAIWDWNLDTDEIYWNNEIQSMFDYNAAEISTGTEWKVHIHPEDFKRVTRKLVKYVDRGLQNWQDEYRFRCKNGSYKYIYNRGFILFDNDNRPYRIIAAMQDVTELNKLQQSLNNERVKNQQELTKATIQAQEKERTHIGRELHDNINQLLTATKLYLDVAVSQPLLKEEMIKRSSQNLSFCMDEIRKLSSSLVLPSIAINSFTEVIKNLIEPVRLATTINIFYNINDSIANNLPDEHKLNLYRIFQEQINNILKHANARNISISLKYKEEMIELCIKDDGQGFDAGIKREGIGLKNIQSRVELLGGTMKIISGPGEGVLLEILFPDNHANA